MAEFYDVEEVKVVGVTESERRGGRALQDVELEVDYVVVVDEGGKEAAEEIVLVAADSEAVEAGTWRMSEASEPA